MEDFGTGLCFTLNGEDDDIFCQNCPKLREQLKEEENGKEATIQVIQDKVILTDRLVKSFEKKSKLHEQSVKVMADQENVNKLLSERCSKYEAELSRLIGELQLLRTTNQALEEEKEKCSSESSDLRNQIAAYEVTIQQYKTFCDEKKADDIKAVSSKKLLNTKEKEISKLKEEVSRLNNLVQEKKNEVKKRKALYKKAMLHVERFVKNIETSETLHDEKLAKSCQNLLEKVKRFGTMCPDDIEGSFDSEAEDGRRIEDLLHSDIEASPVAKSSHVAVINPQYETKSNLSHGTSGAECTTAGTKDKKDHAFTQHASLNKKENVCSVVNNGFHDGHLQQECISATTSAVVIHQQVSNCDPSLCNNVCGNGSLGEISNPSSFKNSVVGNSDAQVGKAKESNVCEATSNQDLISKNGNYIEAENIFLDGSNSLDDFSSDFAEMKSQMCLKKEMLSPLSPLPPTPPPRSSSSPDTFRDRCANTTCNDRSRGRSTERHRTIPWSKNLLHQPSEGFEPGFDDLTNGSNNEYLQQQRQSTSYLQPSSEREGNSNVLEVNGTSAGKSFEASITYDDKADCFSLSVDPQSKGVVMIKAFKNGIVSFNWRDLENRRHVRSSSCVARIQSPPSENKTPPPTQSRGKCNASVGSSRVQDQIFGDPVINQEYTDKSSSLRRKLFKEPRLPQFTAASTVSSNNLTRPSSDSSVKSENINSSFRPSFRKASEQNMPFAAHVKPSTANKPFVNCESSPSVCFHPTSEVTASNSSNQLLKDSELLHMQKPKAEEQHKCLVLNKSESAKCSCSPQIVNVDDDQPSSKHEKRYWKQSNCVSSEKPVELSHSEFSEGGQLALQTCKSSDPHLAFPVQRGSFSRGPLNSTSEDLLGGLNSNATFHKVNKCVSLGKSNIPSIPCSKFQSLSNMNEQESSQSDTCKTEKKSVQLITNKEISSMDLLVSEVQNVSDKVQTVLQKHITGQTFDPAAQTNTEFGESSLTVQSPTDTACGNVHENQDKKVPSEEHVSLQHSVDQDMKDVSKEASVPAKKLKQIRLQRGNRHLQSDEGDTSPKFSDISGSGNKREDMTAEHHSGSTVSLKSPKNSSPKEIYSPSLPPCKLSEVDEGESLTSQSELCDLETLAVHPPKKRKRSVSLATRSKVRKVSSMDDGPNSLETGLECQETNEVIASGESHVAFTTTLGRVDTDDLNETKLQDSESPNGSAGSVFSGNARSPEKIHSPTLPPAKLCRADEDESLSLTELHDLDTKAEQPGKRLFPQKKKKLAKAPPTHERSDQDNCEHNLRSSKSLQVTKLRSHKPVLSTSSSHKSRNSSIKSENVMKTKKKHEAKKQFSEESMCSPDKPSTPDFVQARFQKIKNLNSLDEILEPVKPKKINCNKRKRLEMSHTPLSNGAVNGNIQNGSHEVQAASLPEDEHVVDNIPVNGELVVSDNKEDSDLPTGNETQTVGNKVVDVASVNGIRQTLTSTTENQNDGEIDMVDVEQNIKEENISNLENSQNTEGANFPLSGVGSKTVVVTVATVHKGIDCDVSSRMCNSNQERIITQSAYEIPGSTNQLNGFANVYGAGDVNAKVAVNGESVENLASHAIIKKDWSTNCVPVFDSVLTEKNDHSESLEQKCIFSVENKDPFISPLCDDGHFLSGLGNVGFNPVLCKHLESLKKASSFNCRGSERVLMTALCNPVVVPNVQEAVSTIVHFLSSCDDDDPFQNEVEISDINPPVIFSYEEYLVNCVLQVQGKDKPHLKNFLQALFSVIKAQIIFNKSLKPCGATSLCRVFTKLHKISNDLVGPRVLCYDILVAYPDACNVPYLLAAIVGVWPKVLEFEEVFQGTKNPMNMAISSILFNGSCTYSDGATKCLQVIRHLSKLCPPENLPSLSTEVLKKIFADLVNNEDDESLTEEQAHHYAKAVELICFREGWKFAYNSVLCLHLYPFLNRWIVKNSTSEQPGNLSAIKIIFHLLCVICCVVPPEESKTINFILTTLKSFLTDPTQKAPFGVQEAAFVTLLRLGSLNEEIAIPTVIAWLEKNKIENISPSTVKLLKALPYITSSKIGTPRFQI